MESSHFREERKSEDGVLLNCGCCGAPLETPNLAVQYQPCGCLVSKDCMLQELQLETSDFFCTICGREVRAYHQYELFQGGLKTVFVNPIGDPGATSLHPIEIEDSVNVSIPDPVVSDAYDHHTANYSMAGVILATVWNGISQFFLARTGKSGLRIGAIFRVCFALIYLYDRFLIHLDLDFFYSKTEGVLPANSSRRDVPFSVFRYPTNNVESWVRVLHFLGIVQGILLMVGILPRLQAICLYIHIVSFFSWNSLNLQHDNQDALMATLAFFLCFLPLHQYSLPQLLWSKDTKTSSSLSSSWPIWPFRLIQCQIVFIYWGAGIGKLSYSMWRRGETMHYVVHDQAMFGGIWQPNWLYDSVGMLQILTWASLALELVCWILVWPLATRRFMVFAMVLFHLGIELAMNLHTFQWLSMLTWLAFLVQLDASSKAEGGSTVIAGEEQKRNGDNDPGNSGNRAASRFFRNPLRFFGHVAFPLLVIVALAADTSPLSEFYRMTDEQTVWPILQRLEAVQNQIWSWTTPYLLIPLYLDAGTWNMYSRPTTRNSRAVALIKYRHNDTEHYWVQPEWTKMSAWEKKRHFRQVLYWQNLVVDDSNPMLKASRRALCQRIAKHYGQEKDEIYSVALKVAWAGTPEFNRDQSLKRSPSLSEWLSTPARRFTFSEYDEYLLYVHYPSGDRPDGVDEDEDFSYGWQNDGFWWDDQFFTYNTTSEEYEIAGYPEESADQYDDTDNEITEYKGSIDNDEMGERQEATSTTKSSLMNSEL